METVHKIKSGMARAFFACAWADMAEESGNSGIMSGQEITQIMPREIDPAAVSAADKLAICLQAANYAQRIDKIYSENTGGLSPEDWGHYAAMEAMGHGVGLWEYDVNINVPYMEFGSYSLEKDYF